MPASTSNLGAGFDCLGLTLDLWLEARLVEGEGPPTYAGTVEDLTLSVDLIHGLVGRVPGRRLEVHSKIPVGKGLGSSAAARVAGIALRQLGGGGTLAAPEAIFAEAARLEGHPDNAGPAVYGGLVLASHRPSRHQLGGELGIALAVPDLTIDTQDARERLPRQLARETAVGQAARASALVLGLTRGDGDLIAFGMDDLLAVPYRKDRIPGFDAAVAAGREAGAYGVTISGAGSSLLGLGPRKRATAIAAAMARALTDADTHATPLVPDVAPRGLTLVDSEK